jgi:hypothetical protein
MPIAVTALQRCGAKQKLLTAMFIRGRTAQTSRTPPLMS